MYTILAFNGGGIRGLLSTQMLLELVEQCPDLIQNTNMFAGTSAGAGIAAYLANGGAINQEYQNKQEVIAIRAYGKPGSGGDAPVYEIDTFSKYVIQTYGATTTLATLKPIVLTSFQVTPGVPWKSVLFNNVLGSGGAHTIVDAVVGSGSMPGMFGSYVSPTTHQTYIDGAFFDHDPSVAAIAVAVASGVPIDQIALIDIGTGLMPQGIPAGTVLADWGANNWQAPLPSLPSLLSGSSTSGTPFENMSLNGTSVGTTATLAALMLNSRFVSLNPTLTSYIAENDVSGIPALIAAGKSAVLTQALRLIRQYWNIAGSTAIHAAE